MEKEPRSRNSFLLSMCCMCLHKNIFQKLLREGALGMPGKKNTTGKFVYLETILSWTIEGFLVPREKASIVQEFVKPVPICQCVISLTCGRRNIELPVVGYQSPCWPPGFLNPFSEDLCISKSMLTSPGFPLFIKARSLPAVSAVCSPSSPK